MKIVAWSARAIAISVTPLASARSMASEVGAESATSVDAPKIAALATISNEQRLVMTKKPSAGATPLRDERADQFVERIVPPDILAQGDDRAVAIAPGGAMDRARLRR